MIIKNKKAEVATVIAIIAILMILASVVMLNQFKGITGFITLNFDNVSSQSIDNKIVLDFIEPSEQIIYIDLGNYTFTSAVMDISGIVIDDSYPSKILVDIFNDNALDWSYYGDFNSTESISDFSYNLNNYIANCGTYPCPVAIKVSAESAGQIVLSNLELLYEETIVNETTIQENITREKVAKEVLPVEETAYTNLQIKDSNGNNLINQLTIKDEEGRTISEVTAGEYNVDIVLENNPVKKIELRGVKLDENTTEFIGVDDVPEFGNYVEVYAIDPTKVNFTDATVTVTAKGTELYKCKDWNFTEQICYGTWAKLMDITPGINYTFTLTPEDPGFAEYNFSTYPTVTISGQKAYASINAGTAPPASGPNVPNEAELTAAQYRQINSSDNVRLTSTTTGATTRAHRFLFNITQSINSIMQINFTWEGYNLGSQASRRNVSIYVWNFTGNSWGASLASGTANGVDQNLSVSLNSGFNNYINSSGAFIFIAEGTDARAGSSLYTDYVFLNVKYDLPPNTTLNTPSANYWNDGSPVVSVSFNCSAADDFKLVNLSLYITNSSNQSFALNSTTSVSGISNSTKWNLNLTNGNYSWNCYACDNVSQCAFASTNWTVTVNYSAPDITPPASVTNLANQSAGYTWIYWNWTNPADSDFNHTEVWINGTFYANVSKPTNYYNATGLTNNTWYQIQTRTADNFNNVNATWVTNLAKTIYDCPENWTAQYTACNISNKQIKYYTDQSSCGTNEGLPVDNGTVEDCNYCTSTWTNVNSSCHTNDTFDITYTYTNSCCADTGLPSDCNIPANTTDVCNNCTENITGPFNTSCNSSSMLTSYYVDTNYSTCCAVTNLSSDCSIDTNLTYANRTLACQLPPNATNFQTIYGSTNFNAVANLSNVTNLTLANQNGKIQFPAGYGVDAEGENYDVNINLGIGFISVNTSALDPSFNSTANLTIENVSCPAPVYYKDGFFLTREDILAGGQDCATAGICSNINCTGTTLNFTVSHFTGFAAGATTNLIIWDETDAGMPYAGQTRYPENQTRFFANYTNSTGPIEEANCTINFNGLSANMTWNTTGFYEYNRSFTLSGIYPWNVTCNKTGYDTLTANDTVLLSYETLNVTLVSPKNYYSSKVISTFTFNCSASDTGLTNLMLYVWNSTGSLIHTNATNITGSSNSSTFNYRPPYFGMFKWNCLASESGGSSGFAPNNYTLVAYNISASPLVMPISPANNSVKVKSNVSFIFHATANNGSLDCNLVIDDNSASSFAMNSSRNATSANLADGNHTWKIVCIDGTLQPGVSEERAVTVNTSISDTTAPTVQLFWPESNHKFYTTTAKNISVIYNVTDNYGDIFCTLWTNITGSWSAYAGHTNYIIGSGEIGYPMLNNLGSGTYKWNVNCTDSSGNPAFAPSNYTFQIIQPGPGNCDSCADCEAKWNSKEYSEITLNTSFSYSGSGICINKTKVIDEVHKTLDGNNYAITGSGSGIGVQIAIGSPMDIMMIQDVSGSMRWVGKIGDAKTAGITFINQIPTNEGHQVGLVTYAISACVDVCHGLTTDFNTIKSNINGLSAPACPAQCTAIADAIQRARTDFGSSGRPKIAILLTDGLANIPEPEEYAIFLAIQQAQLAAAEGIKIFTIGFGAGADMGLLNTIASITGGEAYFAPDGTTLAQVYQNIADNNFYIYNHTIKDVTINNFDTGVRLYNVKDSEILNSNISDCNYGTKLEGSTNINLTGNTYNARCYGSAAAPTTGIYLWNSDYNNISSNTLYSTCSPHNISDYGIYIDVEADFNDINHNTIKASNSSWEGIYIDGYPTHAYHNPVTYNTLINSSMFIAGQANDILNNNITNGGINLHNGYYLGSVRSQCPDNMLVDSNILYGFGEPIGTYTYWSNAGISITRWQDIFPPYGSTDGPYNVTISNNYLVNCYNVQYGGLSISTETKGNMSVLNNRLINSSGIIFGESPAAYDIGTAYNKVNNNWVENCSTCAWGISINMNHVIARNNTVIKGIDPVYGAGGILYIGTNATIESNKVNNTSSSYYNNYGIRLNGNYGQINSNTVENTDGYGIYANGHHIYLTSNSAVNSSIYSYFVTGGGYSIADTSNIGGYDGKPFLYVTSKTNYTVSNSDAYSEIEFAEVNNSLINNVTILNPGTISDGVVLVNSRNITINNSNLSYCYRSVYGIGVNNSNITSVKGIRNEQDGIYLENSNNNTVSNSIISDINSTYPTFKREYYTSVYNDMLNGIYVSNGKGNNITDNTIRQIYGNASGGIGHRSSGIRTYSHDQLNNISNNIIENIFGYSEGYGVYLNDINNSVINNTINNIGSRNGGYGIGYSINRNTISLNKIDNITSIVGYGGTGISASSYNTISSNSINHSYTGMDVSSDNNLTSNTCDNSNSSGFYITGSRNNLTSNTAINTISRGIYIVFSSFNRLVNNSAVNNSYGIHLYDADYNNLTLNTIRSNYYGVYIEGGDYGNLTNNTFANNLNTSIYIYYGSYNKIYYNNFYNATVWHAYNSPGYANYFNTTGSDAQGNYWDDIEKNGLDIYDTNHNIWGDSGTQYPYSRANGGNVSPNVVDWGPIVTASTIYARNLSCEVNGTTWVNCTTLTYGNNLTRVRINCTDLSINPVLNATFNMTNLLDSDLKFSVLNATEVQGDWWIYDNADFIISQGGNWTINAGCINNWTYERISENWSLPYWVKANNASCEINGTTWMNCSFVNTGYNLTRIRVNCTSLGGVLRNATFNFTNLIAGTKFYATNATEVQGVWWIYDNNDYIMEGGPWLFNATCIDNHVRNSTFERWNLSYVVNATNVSCEKNGSNNWVDCTTLTYNDNLTRVRVNCSIVGGFIVNATFNLTNIPDNDTKFYAANATEVQGDWWIYDNNDLIIRDGGQWKINATCTDNLYVKTSSTANWSLPWGWYNATTITGDRDVTKNISFVFETKVQCIGGECGNTSATLDPEQELLWMPQNKSGSGFGTESSGGGNVSAQTCQADCATGCAPYYGWPTCCTTYYDYCGTCPECSGGGCPSPACDGYAPTYCGSGYSPTCEAACCGGGPSPSCNYQSGAGCYYSNGSFDSSSCIQPACQLCPECSGGTYLCSSMSSSGPTCVSHERCDWDFMFSSCIDDSSTQCIDSGDNDGDGLADCNDPDCSALTICIDADGDGINNTNDTLTGNSSNVHLIGLGSLNISIDGIWNSSPAGNHSVVFYKDNTTQIFRFSWNFTASNKLDLNNIYVDISSAHGIYVEGISNTSKTFYLPFYAVSDGACIKNANGIISNTVKCNGTGEHLINKNQCDGTPINLGGDLISCTFNSTNYIISGLTHSGGEAMDKGVIPFYNPLANQTPFYSLTNNPSYSCGNLYKDDVCNVSWTVVPTGDADTTWKFFAIFNSTYAGVPSNQTNIVNITIVTFVKCGNGLVELGETCDGTNFSNLNCSDFNDFTAGNLICNNECQINTSNCTGGNSGGFCGDGIIQTGETCDNVSIGVYNYTGLLCTDFDTFQGGFLNCTNCLINTTNCTYTDGFPPKVYLITPNDTQVFTSTNNVTLNVSATDNVDLDNCTLYTNISGWQANETRIFTGTSDDDIWNLNDLANGDYIWNAYCCDAAGLCAWNNTNFTFTVSYTPPDTTPPLVFLNLPANATNFTSTNNVTFNVSATDNVGLDNCTLYTNVSGLWTANETKPFTGTYYDDLWNLNDLPNGTFIWNAYCCDNSSNCNWNNTNFTFYVNYPSIDLIPPTVILVSPENNTIKPDTTVDFVYKVYDNIGPIECRLWSDYSAGWTNLTSWTSVQEGQNAFSDVQMPVLGTYLWNVECRDTNNNASAPYNWTIIIDDITDTIPPEVYLIAPENNTIKPSGTVDFVYDVFDNYDLDCRLWTNYSGAWDNLTAWTTIPDGRNAFANIPFTADGFYVWNVECKDGSGNSANATVNYTLTINSLLTDNEAPEVYLISPENNTYKPTGTVDFVYEVYDDYDLDCRLWTNKDGAWQVVEEAGTQPDGWTTVAEGQSFFTNIPFPTLGTYLWNVECRDASGKYSFAASNYTLNIDDTIVDTESPEVYLIAPENNTIKPNGTVDFIYEVYDVNDLDCRLWSNRTGTWQITRPWISVPEGQNFFANVLFADSGTYVWNVECRDGNNNYAFASANYTLVINSAIVDNEPPEVYLISPPDGTTKPNGTVDFIYEVYDNYDLDCRLWTNETGTWEITRPWISVPEGQNFFANVLFAADGTYVWNVECRDGSNNYAFADNNFTLIINSSINDTTPPVVMLVFPPNGTTKPNTTVDFIYNVTDDYDLDCRLWTNYSGNWQVTRPFVSVPEGQNAFSNIAFPIGGNYIWNVECRDSSNKYAFAQFNWTIIIDDSLSDTIPPNVTLISPPNASTVLNTTVNLTYQINDNFDPDCRLWTNISGTWDITRTWVTVPIGINTFPNIPIPVPGEYIWNVECKDGSNNAAFAQYNWTLIVVSSFNDTTLPEVYLIIPPNDSMFSTIDNINFTVNATDNMNLSNCTLYTNRTGWNAESTRAYTGTQDQDSWNITFTTPGDYIWNAYCCDANNNCAWNNTNYTIHVYPWLNVTYPEGVYEPYNATVPGTHLFFFNISATDFNVTSTDTVACVVNMSDGSLYTFINNSMPDENDSTVIFNYSVTTADLPRINKTRPWQVLNCTVADSTGKIKYFDHPYDRRFNYIYTHENQWTRFDSADDDGYRARMCFLGVPKSYFKNHFYCDYAGDVAFAVTMSLGMTLEGYCHDSIDDDSNGNIDCADIYCQGITYTCKQHAWAGDPFAGTCTNGICSESKTIGGQSITYYYNNYTTPNGRLKVRFDGGAYSTSQPISFAISDVNFTGSGKYAAPGSYELPTDSTSFTSYITEDTDGYLGDIDMVMWVDLDNYAAGSYNVSIDIVQNGETLHISGIPIFIDASAPNGNNESEPYAAAGLYPCNDTVDNDLDYSANCADSDCLGYIGGVNCTGEDVYCQAAESRCNDCFDNDANQGYDCADPDCNGLPGNYLDSSDVCQYSIETGANCSDSFDNDQQGGIDCLDTTLCWKQGGFCPAAETSCSDNIDNDYDSDYSQAIDSDANTGKDCRDYDCEGDANCPARENQTSAGTLNASQCFDNMDNDLDDIAESNSAAYVDCSDVDCLGVANPSVPNQKCVLQEFLIYTFQYCNNVFDDDADGPTDCADSDCERNFGPCGPCPDIEDYLWDTCADSANNDREDGTDCADHSDCDGEIGRKTSSQICQATETNCSDLFDNDADGATDCADVNCLGRQGPDGICGSEDNIAACDDDYDNDGDVSIDCIDNNCWGIGDCSLFNWTTSSPCLIVPYNETFAITPTTVTATNLRRHHVDTNYTIRLVGSGTYDVVTITLGDATNPSRYFPYNTTTCTLTGTAGLKWVATHPEVGQIQHEPTLVNSSSPLSGFDVTLTCAALSTPQTNTYPINVVNLLSGATPTPEIGSVMVTATVYENIPPIMYEIEIEPLDDQNKSNIDFGDSIGFRGIPNNDSSGICQCSFNVSGTTQNTSGSCIYSATGFNDDQNVTVNARARDGANNYGSWTLLQTLTINFRPYESTGAAINKTEPFFKSNETLFFSTGFTTAVSGNFDATNCTLYIEAANGTIVNITNITKSGAGNAITCSGIIEIPDGDSLYRIYVNVTDEDNDSVLSDKKAFYVCDSLASAGTGADGTVWTCAKADFDQDRWTEGVTVKPGLYFDDTFVCDMCTEATKPGQPALWNNTGLDNNANGIDNICDLCGNGIIDSGEQCDGVNLSTTQCSVYDPATYSSGILTCRQDCQYDVSSCAGYGIPAAAARGGMGPSICGENWTCSDWSECYPNGTQWRTCHDESRCEERYNKKIITYVEKSIKPYEVKDCLFTGCEDGIRDWDETDIDCGGGVCQGCEDGQHCYLDRDCIHLCNKTAERCYSPAALEKPFLLGKTIWESVVDYTTFKFVPGIGAGFKLTGYGIRFTFTSFADFLVNTYWPFSKDTILRTGKGIADATKGFAAFLKDTYWPFSKTAISYTAKGIAYGAKGVYTGLVYTSKWLADAAKLIASDISFLAQKFGLFIKETYWPWSKQVLSNSWQGTKVAWDKFAEFTKDKYFPALGKALSSFGSFAKNNAIALLSIVLAISLVVGGAQAYKTYKPVVYKKIEAHRELAAHRRRARLARERAESARKLEEQEHLKRLRAARERAELARKHAEEKAKRKSKLVKETAEDAKLKHEEARKVYKKMLTEFVIKSFEQGQSREQIKQALMQKGWPKEFVDKFCDDVIDIARLKGKGLKF